jgi:hypothetical protein
MQYVVSARPLPRYKVAIMPDKDCEKLTKVDGTL